MYITDFEFDGVKLSNFNCIAVTFDGTSDGTYGVGGKTDFIASEPNQSGKKYYFGPQRNEQLSLKIQITKNDRIEHASPYFSQNEISEISRWLNRADGYHKLILESEDIAETSIYYMAQINVSALEYSSNILGLELEINTDRSWGNVDRKVEMDITDTRTFEIQDLSDDIGETKIKMTITPAAAGDLTIKNSLFKDEIIVTDCSLDEKITIDGVNQIVQTTDELSNIAKRFSKWNFPKIANTYNNRSNNFTVSLPCHIVLEWTENRKVGIGL